MKNKRYDHKDYLLQEIDDILHRERQRLEHATYLLQQYPPEHDMTLAELGAIHDATLVPYWALTQIRGKIRSEHKIPHKTHRWDNKRRWK